MELMEVMVLVSIAASSLCTLPCRVMDRKILALEATRDLTHVWAHVDMDAFYASCEELADPSLVRRVH